VTSEQAEHHELVLCRFGEEQGWSLLESYSTPDSRAMIRTVRSGLNSTLRLSLHAPAGHNQAWRIALALPPRAIAGQPERWVVSGCAARGHASVELEVMDGQGMLHLYDLGPTQAGGMSPIGARVKEPVRTWNARGEQVQAAPRVPLVPVRLFVICEAEQSHVDIELVSLSVRGSVRETPPGLAG